MRRRTLLSACAGAIGGLAGCTGRRRDRGGDETPTPDPQVEVSLDRYQPAAVTLFEDAIHPGLDDGSYLYLSVDATDAEDPPAPDEFAFRAERTQTAPVDVPMRSVRLYRYSSGEDHYGAPGVESGWILFELPETVAGDPRVTWPEENGRAVWRPDDRLRARLTAGTPPLSATFSVPETIPVREPPTLSLTIDNEGDLPARYVARLNRIGPSVAYTPVASVSVLVDAGGTETWRHEDSYWGWPDADEVGDGDPDVTYTLERSRGRRERRVRVVSADD